MVRFRIDGVLQHAGNLVKTFYDNILNRVKVQAQLRTDEHQATQDGSIRHVKQGQVTDLRISIIPTLEGEKVVMRVLTEYVKGLTLSSLGLSPEHEELVRTAAKKPFGMILAVGPTGSGKSTTLYSVLRILNNPGINITTIEDPVEYRLEGVNHIQVNPRTELTFARGLRSIVRQDPDVILVGEIRDKETAVIAVNAALTGQLLLSTFHSNDAATAIPRLLYMGTEPFLLASTLEIVIAQRLVRKICEECKVKYTLRSKELAAISGAAAKFLNSRDVTLFKGEGCQACSGTGYKGRTAIYEIIRVTPEMEDLILKNPSSKQVWEMARQQGAGSLFEDGLRKIQEGQTTIEELTRVASPTIQD